MPAFPLTITTPPEAAGQRLDQYLAAQLSELVGSEVSRARVQQLIAKGEVLVDSAAAKASDNASSAPATSRIRAARKATSLP